MISGWPGLHHEQRGGGGVGGSSRYDALIQEIDQATGGTWVKETAHTIVESLEQMELQGQWSVTVCAYAVSDKGQSL